MCGIYSKMEPQTIFRVMPEHNNMKTIIQTIQELAQRHHADDTDDSHAEMLEFQALNTIAKYILERQLIQVETLPFEQLAKEYDDYYSYDQLLYIVDAASLEHADVLELNWRYTHAFWPEELESKEDLERRIKEFMKNVEVNYDLENYF